MADTHAHAAGEHPHGPATPQPYFVVFGALCVFLGSAGVLLALQSARLSSLRLHAGDTPPLAEGPDDFGSVGAFAFTERSGRAVTQESLRGRVWVVGCFFTCCTESCPQLSG